MPTARFRHELKYLVNVHQYIVLRQRLRAWLRPDPHADPSGEYRVTSLYLDDAADSALVEKLSGVPNRWKMRVRTYNGRDDFVQFEKKIKTGEGIRKVRVRLDRRLYEAIRAGDPGPLREAGEGGHPLLAEVARRMVSSLLRPKVVVDYTREAYVHPLGNVRVTFDKGLRSGLTNLDLFRPAPFVPAPISGLHIMEIKYDAFLPRPVQDLLQTDSLTRQAVSKYVLCRSLMGTQAWGD